MNALSPISIDTLPVLIGRATAALDNARSSAEVLEARDVGRTAYDAAKVAARVAKASHSDDSIIAELHRAQADALVLRTRAEIRLAERYDAEKKTAADKKADWISAARRTFTAGSAQPCEICGRFTGIAHAHHIAPLAMQYDAGIREAIQSFSWLCPNHHTAVHALIAAFPDTCAIAGELMREGTLVAALDLVISGKTLIDAGKPIQLRRSADARNEHADALEAEGQMKASA